MFTPVTCLSPHICRNKTDLGLGIGYLYSNVLKNETYFVKHSTSFFLYYCAFQKHADSNAKFNQQNECFFCCRQSNVRRLFPASDYCRVLFRSVRTVFSYSLPPARSGSSRRLGGAGEHLIVGSEKPHLSVIKFRFRVLLKGAVNINAFFSGVPPR